MTETKAMPKAEILPMVEACAHALRQYLDAGETFTEPEDDRIQYAASLISNLAGQMTPHPEPDPRRV